MINFNDVAVQAAHAECYAASVVADDVWREAETASEEAYAEYLDTHDMSRDTRAAYASRAACTCALSLIANRNAGRARLAANTAWFTYLDAF